MAEENLYTPDCIRTYTGIYVNVFDPKPEMFAIEDIAHALSMQPRFGGHLPYFYSVAQHCCQCCYLTMDEHKYNGLMHDASEAYLMDIPSPIKQHLANYKEIEHRLMTVLADVFKFQYPLPEGVKDTDKLMLELEWCNIMIPDGTERIDCWDQYRAKENFLTAYKLYRP